MAHAIPEEIVDLVESVVHAIFDEAARRVSTELKQPTAPAPTPAVPCQVVSLDAYRERRSPGVAR